MKTPQTAQLSGLGTYLSGYVRKHYPNLRVAESFTDSRGAFAICALQRGEAELLIRLRVPLNAPVNARPLFDSVYNGKELLWRYSDDYRPTVPWGEQRRIHLYEMAGVDTLVHVIAGSPVDIIEKVTALNGGDFNSPTLAAVLRVHVAKLWGMTTTLRKAERRELAKLQKDGLTDKS